MLDGAAQRSSRTLRPQGNGTAALIIKGIHFFLHHISGISHRPVKQLGMLKGGDTNLPETVQPRDFHDFFL